MPAPERDCRGLPWIGRTGGGDWLLVSRTLRLPFGGPTPEL